MLRIQALREVLEDMIMENIERVGGRWGCRLDGGQYETKELLFAHLRLHHRVFFEAMLANLLAGLFPFSSWPILLSDMEIEFLGNVFTKLAYSNFFYSPHVEPAGESIPRDFPAALAPALTLPAQGKKHPAALKKAYLEDIFRYYSHLPTLQ